jgi:hypothetical protein
MKGGSCGRISCWLNSGPSVPPTSRRLSRPRQVRSIRVRFPRRLYWQLVRGHRDGGRLHAGGEMTCYLGILIPRWRRR